MDYTACLICIVQRLRFSARYPIKRLIGLIKYELDISLQKWLADLTIAWKQCLNYQSSSLFKVDKGYKGTVVNRVNLSFIGGLLKITSTDFIIQVSNCHLRMSEIMRALLSSYLSPLYCTALILIPCSWMTIFQSFIKSTTPKK